MNAMPETPETRETMFVCTLKEMMAQKDVNQADIAHVLRKSPQYVSDVLRARRDPFLPKQLGQLCDAYGFDLHKLLVARAWTMHLIDIPKAATYEHIVRAVRIVNMQKEREERKFV